MMSRALLSAAALVAIVCFTPAQQPAAHPPQTEAVPSSATLLLPAPTDGDTLHMQTHIGSFKIVPKGDKLPVGRLEFSFTGTVLVSGVTPGSYIKTSGNVHEEYSNPAHAKTLYHGTGKILIVGSFANCEWFGGDLDLTFKGSAIFRVITEFDKNKDTGSFYFDPKEKNSLQVTLLPIDVPRVQFGPKKAILREDFEKQKAQRKGG